MAMYPVQTIVVILLLSVGYLIIRNTNEVNTTMSGSASRRRAALNQAKLFLSPYSSIWKNLRLSNKFCTIRLGADGQTIKAKDNINNARSFRVVRSHIHSMSDLWNMFCLSFGYNTTFDELLELSRKFNLELDISGNDLKAENVNSPVNNKPQQQNVIPVDTDKKIQIEKLDINNASEIELTSLPGISIVTAKKLIKKREEINGFKSVNDVFLFLRLKPHMQTQLENLICVKKMKGNLSVQRYNERSIDL